MTSSKLQKLISILAAFVILCGCVSFAFAAEQQASFPAEKDGYKLKRIVIFSRHSIRAPLKRLVASTKTVTPHKWTDWSADPGDLTERGGIIETFFGQYFRRALEKIGFIPKNWVPEKDEARFRSNSLQRTIATARYFASGFLPCADIRIEHRNPIDEPDPEIHPMLHFTSEEYRRHAKDYIAKHMDIKDQKEIFDRIRDGLKALESILDYKDSELAKKTGSEHFPAEKIDIDITKDAEAVSSGDILTAMAAVDALSLQYLEGNGDRLTAFGHALTEKDVSELNQITDIFYDAMCAPYEIAINTVHPVLIYLRDELLNNTRKFSFTCGHDDNIVPIMSALRVEPYKLEGTFGSNRVPIGCKLVFSVYDGPNGKEYAKVNMMYLSADQIREMTEVNESNPPKSVELSLSGLKKNADGYYALDDVIGRFDEAIDAYWTLPGNSKDESDSQAA